MAPGAIEFFLGIEGGGGGGGPTVVLWNKGGWQGPTPMIVLPLVLGLSLIMI